MSPDDEDALDQILRGVAQTPDVTGLRRAVGVGARLARRFCIEAPLGRGGMGSVFSAYDERRAERVALKLLGSLTPSAIRRIKHEFRIAAELSHPCVVGVHELFADGAEWFLTMDLVEGASLDKFVQRHGPLSMNTVRTIFGQLATGLQALHDVGIVHGDLTPRNFLIGSARPRVVLLDFGVAQSAREPGSELLAGGTPGYMSPEQMAGARIAEASDWYSFGVVLREALAAAADADAELTRLCSALLRDAPEARPSGAEVFRVLGIADGLRSSSTPPPSQPRLLGRDNELGQLSEAYAAAARGEPAVVLVEGPSGIGKSSLIEGFLRRVRNGRIQTLAGRCRERESVSHKAVDVLMDDVLELLEQLPQADARAILPAGIADLCKLFPVLRSAPVVARSAAQSPSTPDQTLARQRAIAALRELMVNLGTRGTLTLWIDDLQWSDPESAELLAPILSGAGALPLLFLASFRPLPEGRGATLDKLLEVYGGFPGRVWELRLQPLAQCDAERLAHSCLPPQHPQAAVVAAAIAREAKGHPLFIAELAHSTTTAPRTGQPRATSLAELVSERVSTLTDETRSVLMAVAVAGAPVSRPSAQRFSGLSPSAFERALDALRTSRLARTSGVRDDMRCDVAHDRIREIVLSALTEGERRKAHVAVALALQAEPGQQPAFIASHFQAGGRLDQASRYWIEAADQACRSLAFSQAAQFYALGVSQVALPPHELLPVRVRQAEALALSGAGPSAAELYLQVANSAPHDQALEYQRRAAEQLLLSGHLERGLAVVRQVLDALGMRDTRSGRSALLSIALGRARVRLLGLQFELREEAQVSKRDIARIDASWTVAASLGVVDFLRGADFQNEHLLLALRAGEPLRLMRALILEISYGAAKGVGSEPRTERLLALVDHLMASVPDPAVIALAQLSRGIAVYLQGRIGESIPYLQRALDMLRSHTSGAVWETVTAQRFTSAALFYTGKLGSLRALVPPILADAERQGNLYASVAFRSTFANTVWLVDDDTEEARRQLACARGEWTSAGFQLPHSWMLVGETYLSFYERDGASAWARILENWPRIEQSRLLLIGAIRVQLWHLRAAAALSASRVAHRKGQAASERALLGEARFALRKLAEQPTPIAKPLTLLLQAGIDRAQRKEQRAAQGLEECTRQFRALGMPLFAASANVRRYEGNSHTLGDVSVSLYGEFTAEGVKKPACMVELLAPGFDR